MELKMMAARFAAKAIVLFGGAMVLFAILSLEGCGSAPEDATSPEDAGETVTAEETVETITMDDGSEIVVDSEGNVVSTSGGAAAEYVASHGSSGVSASKVQSDTGRQVSSATTTKPVTRPATGGAPVTSGGNSGATQGTTSTQPATPQAPAQVACAHDWQPVYESREVTVVEAYDQEYQVEVGKKWQCSCGAQFDSTSALHRHQDSYYDSGNLAGHGGSGTIPVYETKVQHVPAVTETQSVHVCDKCSKCGATK